VCSRSLTADKNSEKKEKIYHIMFTNTKT